MNELEKKYQRYLFNREPQIVLDILNGITDCVDHIQSLDLRELKEGLSRENFIRECISIVVRLPRQYGNTAIVRGLHSRFENSIAINHNCSFDYKGINPEYKKDNVVIIDDYSFFTKEELLKVFDCTDGSVYVFIG